MNIFYFVIVSIFLFSCQSDQDKIRSHFEYLNNPNCNLTKTFVGRDYRYKVSYITAEAMAYMANRNSRISLTNLKKLSIDYQDMIYFNLDIEKQIETKDKLPTKFTAFDFQHYIFLIQEDTVPCRMFHLENAGNISGIYQYQMGFDASNISKERDINLFFRRFGIDSSIIFNFSIEDINNVMNL